MPEESLELRRGSSNRKSSYRESTVFVFWLRNRPPWSMYLTRGMEGVIQNVYRCVQGDKGITSHVYVRTYTISFHIFCLMVSCFIYRNLTLPSFKKGQKWLFFSNEINFCCNEIIFFFYFKLFFRTKISQNAFNFNQIESHAYSVF